MFLSTRWASELLYWLISFFFLFNFSGSSSTVLLSKTVGTTMEMHVWRSTASSNGSPSFVKKNCTTWKAQNSTPTRENGSNCSSRNLSSLRRRVIFQITAAKERACVREARSHPFVVLLNIVHCALFYSRDLTRNLWQVIARQSREYRMFDAWIDFMVSYSPQKKYWMGGIWEMIPMVYLA